MVEPKEFWSQKAEQLKRTGKFEEAVFALDKIHEIEKEERQSDYWYKRGIQYFDIGNYEEAKKAIYKHLELGNKGYEHFVFLGKILYKLEEFEESLESLNKASEENARKYLKNTIKIDQMKNVRKFEDAVKYSNEIFTEKGLDSEYWHLKGLVLFKLEKFKESSLSIEKALESNKTNIFFQYDLAKSELWGGNKEKTVKILTRIASKDSSIKEKLKNDKDFDKIREEIVFLK